MNINQFYLNRHNCKLFTITATIITKLQMSKNHQQNQQTTTTTIFEQYWQWTLLQNGTGRPFIWSGGIQALQL